MSISVANFKFLKDLAKNNNRDWFQANKDRYVTAHENTIAFMDDLIEEMNKFDHIENESGKKSLMRIYRDVRFSKDKSPYKAYWMGSMRRATKALRGGYFVSFVPGNKSRIGGGFYNPESADLRHIRNQIALDPDHMRKAIRAKSVLKTFGEMRGDQLKTAPKGFPKDHPAIDLLRHKNFYFLREFNDKDLMDKNAVKNVAKTLNSIRPFFDYMSEILTTDLNGESTL